MTKPHPFSARLRCLRLTEKDLAALAGVHPDTLAKTLAGRCDTKSSTLGKIERALIAEERRVLAHLARLHPEFSLPEAGLPPRPTVPAPPVARPGNGGFSSQEHAA